MALGLQRQGTTFFLIQLYLRTGETLQSPLNAGILGHLLAFLEWVATGKTSRRH